MQRRNLLAGLGGLAGAAGIVGTGAFTSVSADRGLTVDVADDTDALLRLAPCSGSDNSGYVTETGDGTMTLDLSDSSAYADASGVNAEATTVIQDVFEICNQGTQTVGVWLNIDPVQNGNQNDAVSLYQDSQQNAPIVEESNAVCLGPGDCVCVGLIARTSGLDSSFNNLFQTVSGNSEMVVHADADAAGACSQPRSVTTQSLDTGTADWEVEALPPDVSGPEALPYDATVITSPNSAYADLNDYPNVDAQWVGPFDEDASNDDPADDDNPYVYELDFQVIAGSRDLNIRKFGSDNPVTFELDGTEIGGSSDRRSFDSLLDGPTVSVPAGSHTLRAKVINNTPLGAGSGDNPTALLVDAALE